MYSRAVFWLSYRETAWEWKGRNPKTTDYDQSDCVRIRSVFRFFSPPFLYHPEPRSVCRWRMYSTETTSTASRSTVFSEVRGIRSKSGQQGTTRPSRLLIHYVSARRIITVVFDPETEEYQSRARVSGGKMHPKLGISLDMLDSRSLLGFNTCINTSYQFLFDSLILDIS